MELSPDSDFQATRNKWRAPEAEGLTRRYAVRAIRFSIAIAAASLLLTAVPAKAADVSNLIDGHFDTMSKKERAEIARALREKVQKLAQYLPTPRPQESAWLKQESDAIDRLGKSDAELSRRVKLAESPEFQHAKLHSNLTAIRDALTCAAEQSHSISREIMCWSIASLLLTDRAAFNDAVLILLRAGRLPRDIDKQAMLGSESVGFGLFFDMWGRGIQEYVVIPYLKSQAK